MFKKIKYFFFIFLLSFLLINSKLLYAKEESLDVLPYIDSLNTVITAKDNFSFHVEETIRASLKDNHGIKVNIAFEPRINRIRNIGTEGPGYCEIFTDELGVGSQSKAVKTLQLGDSNQKYSGIKVWKVNYDIQGFKKINVEKDYLSLSIIPAYWQLPIHHATTKIIMPKAINWNKIHMVSGKSSIPLKEDSHFIIQMQPNSKEIIFKANNLPKEYGASLGGKLPSHYWKNVPISNHYIYGLLLLNGICLCIILFYVWKYRTRKRAFASRVLFPPQNMDPLQMGYFMKGFITKKDIIAMFFYFSSQGYAQIQNSTSSLGKKSSIDIIKIKNLNHPLPHQKLLFQSMFSEGKIFNIQNSNRTFINNISTIKEKVAESMEFPYTKSSRWLKNILLIAMIFISSIIMKFMVHTIGASVHLLVLCFLGVFSYLIYRTAFYLHCRHSVEGIGRWWQKLLFFLVSFIYLLFYIIALPTTFFFLKMICGLTNIVTFTLIQWVKKRKESNFKIDCQILGLKQFIKEKDKEGLLDLVHNYPNYFNRLFPYTIILGLNHRWTRRFCNLFTIDKNKDNQFYRNYCDFFNTMNFSRHLFHSTNSNSETNSNYSSSLSDYSASSGGSSSSDGFGGGGGDVW